MGQNLRLKRVPVRAIFSCVTIAYLEESSKIKDTFFKKNSYPEIRKTYFLGSKMGVNLYKGIYSIQLTVIYPMHSATQQRN